MNEDQIFMSNLKGSTMANVITGLFLMTFWILKNKCKHSQCKVQNRCFTCSIKENDEERDCERGQRGPRDAQEGVYEVYPREHSRIPPKHKTALSSD